MISTHEVANIPVLSLIKVDRSPLKLCSNLTLHIHDN